MLVDEIESDITGLICLRRLPISLLHHVIDSLSLHAYLHF